MRNLLSSSFSFCLLAVAGIALAGAQTTAPNEWTWEGGSTPLACPEFTYCGMPGVYGTLGAAAAENVPGSRGGASTWTDSAGHLWLYGGSGFDAADNPGLLSDLWEFDPSTNEWTWKGGSSTVPAGCAPDVCGVPGVYGTLGVAAATNNPGSRKAASTWTDTAGHFWLFGGYGVDESGCCEGDLNDLWEFAPLTAEWTWMGGSGTIPNGLQTNLPGVYGTPGVAATGNIPTGRDSAATWIDGSGHFWLFGGQTASIYIFPYGLNDLWEFDPATNLWTWMGGSNTVPGCSAGSTSCGEPGVYGTLGTPAAGNVPSGRIAPSSWTDSNGNFWLFGGATDNALGEHVGYAELNDVWEFNPSTSEWAWMGGSSTPALISCTGAGGNTGACYYGQPGVYGQLGVSAAGNIPGGRDAASNWTDNSGKLWLFGGETAPNDLWEFDPSTNLWTWVGGSSTGTNGVYGTLGTPAAGNIPGNRPYASSWVDDKGNFWLFGGGGEYLLSDSDPGSLNDLWEYVPPPSTATPTFSLEAGTYSTIQTVTISDSATGASIFYTNDGTTPTATSNLYRGPITVATTETIKAIATASGTSRSRVASAAYVINVPPDFSVTAAPATMTVTAGGSGMATISISPQSSFASAVSFACSGLPAGDACSFSPATLTPSGPAAATTTLTVTTAATSASLHENRQPLFPEAALAGVLCLIGFRKRRSLQLMLLLGVSVAGLGLLSACGRGSSGAGSQTITSTVTVTATSGTLIHTTTFTLVVN